MAWRRGFSLKFVLKLLHLKKTNRQNWKRRGSERARGIKVPLNFYHLNFFMMIRIFILSSSFTLSPNKNWIMDTKKRLLYIYGKMFFQDESTKYLSPSVPRQIWQCCQMRTAPSATHKNKLLKYGTAWYELEGFGSVFSKNRNKTHLPQIFSNESWWMT